MREVAKMNSLRAALLLSLFLFQGLSSCSAQESEKEYQVGSTTFSVPVRYRANSSLTSAFTQGFADTRGFHIRILTEELGDEIAAIDVAQLQSILPDGIVVGVAPEEDLITDEKFIAGLRAMTPNTDMSDYYLDETGYFVQNVGAYGDEKLILTKKPLQNAEIASDPSSVVAFCYTEHVQEGGVNCIVTKTVGGVYFHYSLPFEAIGFLSTINGYVASRLKEWQVD